MRTHLPSNISDQILSTYLIHIENHEISVRTSTPEAGSANCPSHIRPSVFKNLNGGELLGVTFQRQNLGITEGFVISEYSVQRDTKMDKS